MIKLLSIDNDDVYLDLCSGTGSFLCESYLYSPKKIIGCEYQKKLFELLRINSFLRNNVFTCINKDCFENKFENITKTAINPPYGMKDKTELDFILKQLESLEENGLAVSIIPISKLNLSDKRQILTKKAKIKQIIICNENLFYPNASVKVCILLLQKNKNGHNFKKDKIKFIDYRKDGFSIKRGFGLIKSNQEEYKEKEIFISDDNNWIQIDINFEYPTVYSMKKYELFLNYQKELLKLEEDNTVIELKKELKNKTIDELFDIIKKPQEKIQENKKVLVITAKNNNNGIKEISESDKNTFSGNKIVLVTGGDGGAGMAYYQELPFKISSSTVVLSPKFDMSKETGMYIALFLQNYKKIYNRGYSWNLERIKNTIIY
jgi:predicted RNA methylase